MSSHVKSMGPWWSGVGLLVVVMAWLLLPALEVGQVRLAIRFTARMSLVCFLMAFTAQAVWSAWPGGFTQWWRQHRRQWGLLFVASHTVHLGCILLFKQVDPITFATLVPMSTVYSGAVAYVLLWAMGLSSNDRVEAWMGRLWWARLHTWGSRYLWLSFMVAEVKRIPQSAIYVLPVAVLLMAVWVRQSAARRRATVI